MMIAGTSTAEMLSRTALHSIYCLTRVLT